MFATQGRFFYLFLVCAAVLTFYMPQAKARQADEPEAQANQTPAAERRIPWDTNCSQIARQDEPDCRMSQMVIVPESRQVLLRIEVLVPADATGTRMVLQLPHGIYLPEGIALEIDEAAWQETAVQTCDGNGCYAGFELDEESLRRLQDGAQLTVNFQSLSREVVSVPVDLDGFSEAYDKIR